MKILCCLILASGLLVSCKSVVPKSYYLLADGAPSSIVEGAVAAEVIGVGPIELAGYLDRPQVTYQQVGQGIALSPNHVWAEPFRRGVAQTLAAHIVASSPNRAVEYFPWRRDSQPNRSVRVQVHGFVRDGANLNLQATWVLVSPDKSEPFQYRHFNRQLTIDKKSTDDVQSVVNAMSGLMALLAEEISEQLSGGVNQ